MTTPNLPWDTTTDSDLPQGVISPTGLGTRLQEHGQSNYTDIVAGRMPAVTQSTPAGSARSGAFGFIVGLFSQMTSNVATADPATINSPDDIVDRAGGFFGGLPLIQTAIIEPLSQLLSWITGRPAEDFDTVDELRDAFFDWLESIPIIGNFVQAITGITGGLSDLGDFFDALFKAGSGVNPVTTIWSKITGLFTHQAAVSNTATAAATTAASAAQSVVNVVAQVNYVQQVIAVQSGVGIWLSGPDPTGTPSFPYCMLNLHSHTGSLSITNGGTHTHDVTGSTGPASTGTAHTHTAGGLATSTSGSNHSHTGSITIDNQTVMTVNATASYAPWISVRFGSAAERKILTFLASKSGTVSTLFIDVYRLNVDGSSTLVWTSPDQAGNVASGGAAWVQLAMSGASITADMGDTYEAQFRMTGSGMVSLVGINMPRYADLPGFRPYTFGSGRNPSTTPAPATISTSDRDAMYTGPVGFMTFGIDVGQTTLPRLLFDDFERATFGAKWITYGAIGISSGRVIYNGGTFDNAAAAAMYAQPLISDTVRAEFDVSASGEAVGVALCGNSGLTAACWAVVRSGSALIQTGGISEGSRTTRATGSASGDGHYILTYLAADNTFRLYKGDDTNMIAAWVDTTNVVAHGDGRRWTGILARRNGLINPSGQLDNFIAADAT